MAVEIAWVLGGLIVGGILVWLTTRRGTSPDNGALVARLDQITQHLDARLKEHTAAISETKSFVTDRVSSNERAFREIGARQEKSLQAVSQQLGKVHATSSAVEKSAREILSFQDMLKHPKIRGGFGEVLLGNLLSNVLSSEFYKQQYKMAGTGEIADAVILLQDGYMVAIDAKFPLANYEIYIREKDEHQRQSLRKVFLRDIKKHIEDIAAKYISPQNNTLDFAFMYIPMEAVFYEILIHDKDSENLWQFCLDHKVIPVSPNSFLAYLQTVLMGLRGLQVQEQAKEIIAKLNQIRQDFLLYSKDFGVVGSHLTKASNKYDESSRRLDKLNNRLDQIDTGSESPQIEESGPQEIPK